MPKTAARYDVIVSERATEMLVDHAGFLAHVSEQAAQNLIDAFEQSANSLREMPLRHAYLEHPDLPRKKYRKFVLNGRYLLLSQMCNRTVYIDYFADCREEWNWLLKDVEEK